ncbi:hypothetical protein CDD82_2708 [Ophiocordyceps australis]|uniref:Uncharacterized protein n=1 Tax=Ophiocordyceps australis TaxID=1399860 RepID=A0A2C5ZAW7_9HYPO|nr:hypothetical protein CDD82_2708 [Ophiocordyceps australis]
MFNAELVQSRFTASLFEIVMSDLIFTPSTPAKQKPPSANTRPLSRLLSGTMQTLSEPPTGLGKMPLARHVARTRGEKRIVTISISPMIILLRGNAGDASKLFHLAWTCK